MQDPSTFQQIKPQFPEQEQLLKCPRCESMNTKFCYYNNYNLSQPRHFCKNCRRYWTKGGALRNIPVGGGTRKNSKRPSTTVAVAAKRSSSSSTITTSASSAPMPNPTMENSDPGHDPTRIYSSGFDIHGSFSSLLASNGLSGQFSGLMEGMDPDVKMVELGEFGENMNPGHGLNSGSSRKSEVEQPLTATMAGNGPDNFLGIVQNGESGCWSGGGNGWPDLAIYTPGSSYQ